MNDLLALALRISVMYLFALAMLRLSGKRSIGDLTPLDFAVATIIGDMFDDVFWAEIPLSQGLVGLATILLLHGIMALVTSRNTPLHRLVNGRSIQVIRRGKVLEDGMAKERTTLDDVWTGLREQGVEEQKLKEVKAAYWEPSGELSLLREEAARPVQKNELERLKGLIP